MKISEAIKVVTTELTNDKEYRRSWSANIAMAFKDRCAQYKKENNKQSLSKEDIHVIANESAEYFIDLLCGTMENQKKKKTSKTK